ncbi:MAG: response regulator [Bauldia sp.]|nr:response regulator [Bauldia sp.]MCW5717886.1 response regulator [Bauldia sp.]
MADSSSGNPARAIVAILDDNQSARESLAYRLAAEGFDVQLHSSPEALLEGDLSAPACLVTNYHMPAMNGLELVSRLRERSIAVPFLLYTGDAAASLVVRAAALGGAVVHKPALGRELIERIHDAIRVSAP